MKEHLHSIVYAIPIPTDLNAAVLTACREELRRQQSTAAPLRVVRYIPAVAAAATCAAVLGVALYTGGPLLSDRYDAPVMDSSDSRPPANTDGASLITDPKGTTQKDTSSAPTDPSPSTTTGKPTDTTTGRTPGRSTTTTTTTVSTIGSTTVNPTRPTTGIGAPSVMGSFHEVATFQGMTVEELEAYYGQKVQPAWLPDGMELRLDPNLPLGIYWRNDSLIAVNETTWNRLLGSGIARDAEVVYDHNQLRWCDFIDGRRELTVYIATAPYPSYKLGDMTRFDDPLTVAGTTVQAAYFEDSADCWCWSALLPKGNIEYYIEGWNISKNEITRVLESLIP